MNLNKKIFYYFDFTSPYSYLAWKKIIETDLKVVPVPVVVGSLIAKLGGVGPGAIRAKREYLFADCLRRASKEGITLKSPGSMPFNSQAMLRMCIAISSSEIDDEVLLKLFITYAFKFGWELGNDYEDFSLFREYICKNIGITQERFDQLDNCANARRQLKLNIKEAIENNLFGVPSFRFEQSEDILWGEDSMTYIDDFINNQDPLNNVRQEFERFKKITGDLA